MAGGAAPAGGHPPPPPPPPPGGRRGAPAPRPHRRGGGAPPPAPRGRLSDVRRGDAPPLRLGPRAGRGPLHGLRVDARLTAAPRIGEPAAIRWGRKPSSRGGRESPS